MELQELAHCAWASFPLLDCSLLWSALQPQPQDRGSKIQVGRGHFPLKTFLAFLNMWSKRKGKACARSAAEELSKLATLYRTPQLRPCSWPCLSSGLQQGNMSTPLSQCSSLWGRCLLYPPLLPLPFLFQPAWHKNPFPLSLLIGFM